MIGRCALALSLVVCGCEAHALPGPAPVFADVAPVLESCVPCHGPDHAEAGYRVDGYLRAIACPIDAGPAVEPPDDTSPIARALAREDHRTLVDDHDRALLLAWVESGALARVGQAHADGWVDPRSEDFHGTVLRVDRWRRMLDATAVGACSRCHAGVGAGVDPPLPAPSATACTSCHTDPDGPRACSTCHGTPGHASPPRDLCFHPSEASTAGAHDAHARANVGCVVCHGERTVDGLGTTDHGDGTVEVTLLVGLAGLGAHFDRATRTCTTSCHDQGGAMPTPSWRANAGLDCQSCHASPPADHLARHYAGSCTQCHAEAAPDGRSLTPGPLHANGRVDLGDGSGGCGACHGHGSDPMPSTGSHSPHTQPTLTTPLACSECHVVPTDVLSPGHLDHAPVATVTFGALATARGRAPAFGADGSCSDVACHGAGLGGGALTQPTWGATDGAASRCRACHGVPPSAPHTTSNDCASIACHGGIVAPGPSLSSFGLAYHVNGRVDLWPPAP